MHKSHFKSIFFILLFTFLSIIAGCSSVDKPATSTLYLYPADGGLVKTDLHSSFKNKIITQIPVDILIINGWIYYTIDDGNHSYILYKIKTDGTQNTMLTKISVNIFKIQKDWIYFTDAKEFKLYRMKTDGSEINCICNKDVSRFAFCNNKIILCILDSINATSKLYSMNTDGTDLINLNIPKNIYDLKASGNLVLFSVEEDDSVYLYALHENQKTEQLISKNIYEFDMDNSHYIYTKTEELNNIYISALNGKEVKKLTVPKNDYGIGLVKIRGNEICAYPIT